MEDNIKKLFEKNNNNKSKFREIVEERNKKILETEEFKPIEDKFIDSQTVLDEKGRPKILRNVIAQRLEDYTISLQEENDSLLDDEYANLTNEQIKNKINEILKKHKFTWTYDERKFMDRFYLNKKETKSIDVRKRKRMYEKSLINQNKMPDFLTINDPLDQIPIHFLRKSSYTDLETGEIKEALYKDTSRGRKDFIRWLILNDLYDKYKSTLNKIPGQSNEEIYQNELKKEKTHADFLANHLDNSKEIKIPTFNTRVEEFDIEKSKRVQFDYSKRPYSFEHKKYQNINVFNLNNNQNTKVNYDNEIEEDDYKNNLNNEIFNKVSRQLVNKNKNEINKNKNEVNKNTLENNNTDIIELKKQILALRKELIDIKSNANQQKNHFKNLKNQLQNDVVKLITNNIDEVKQDINVFKQNIVEEKEIKKINVKKDKKSLPIFFDFDINCVDEFVKSTADKMLQNINVPIMQTLNTKVNINELLKSKQTLQTQNIKVSTIALIAKAISIALLKYKKFNGSYDCNNCLVTLIQSHNFGLVIKTGDDEIKIPVIKEIANKSVKIISQNFDQIKNVVNLNNIVPKDDFSITITNIGDRSNLTKPLLFSSNVAAIGFAKPIKKEIGTRQNRSVLIEMCLSITYDARAFQNREASQFLMEIKNLLENPEILTLI